MLIITSVFATPGEDGSVLRSGQHGGRQPERLPALPAEGDLLPAPETIPAPPLPQRSHQVCLNLCVFIWFCFSVVCSFSPHFSENWFIMPHQERHTVAPPNGSEGRTLLKVEEQNNVEI